MIRSIAAALIYFAIATTAFAQIELSYTKAKSFPGITQPRLLGARVIGGEDSSSVATPVAIITAKSSSKFVRLKARKSIFESGSLQQIAENEWLLSGEGRWIVEATAFDPEKGIDEASLEVVIGAAPKPEPEPEPGPGPGPTPPPPSPVPSDYNIGPTAYSKAPADPSMAKQIATWYRTGSAKLYGQGSLSDIQSIVKEIDRQFDAKQCRDQATCQQWATWKTAVGSALVTEQKRRGTFTRQDWFTALNEIATALEAVK